MALIATKVGWEEQSDGTEAFVIKLLAETKDDIPAMGAADVWRKTPLLLDRAMKKETEQ